MFIPNQMKYDESHCKWSFWTIDSHLFIKLICGFISSISCKIDFWLLFLTLTWHASFFFNQSKIHHQKLGKNQRLNMKHSIEHIHRYKKIIILSRIWNIHLCTSLTAWTKWLMMSRLPHKFSEKFTDLYS